MGPYFDYAVLVCTGGTHFLNPRNPRVVPSIVQFYTIVGTHLSNTSQAFLYSSQSRCTAPTQAVLFLRSIGIFQGSSRSNKTLVLYCPSSIHITHSPYPIPQCVRRQQAFIYRSNLHFLWQGQRERGTSHKENFQLSTAHPQYHEFVHTRISLQSAVLKLPHTLQTMYICELIL